MAAYPGMFRHGKRKSEKRRKTRRKIKTLLIVIGINLGLSLGMLSLRSDRALNLALRVPSINRWVYPSQVYANAPVIETIEAVAEPIAMPDESSSSSPAATASSALTEKEEVMDYILEVLVTMQIEPSG